jgi:3-hydroxyacyl-CoA dehydrogenase
MSNVVKLVKDNDVAVITFDNPPANALSPSVREGLEKAIAEAAADSGIRAIVVTGGGKAFSAGADINEFAENLAAGRNDSPEMHDLFQQFENSAKPVVMAIQGHALGGGLELAMAGHYRVAMADAVVGAPELNLGIIPGAEGTQRLPRLVGLAKAIDLILDGKPIKATEAQNLGIIDIVVESDLLPNAVDFARQMADRKSHPKTSKRTEKLEANVAEHAAILAAGRDKAKKNRKNQTAPLAALAALEAAVTKSFDEGCKVERDLSRECFSGDQAKALIHVFLAQRAVSKIPDIPANTPLVNVKKAGVIGAGTMGSAIAMVFANADIPVLLTDAIPEAIERGMNNIRKNYETSVKRGRFSQEYVDQRLALIHPQPTKAGYEECDIVVEAVFEKLELKRAIFTEIDKIAKPGAILATNTSSLDIDEIAKATSRPQCVIGLHFFSPANVMKLVEVVRGKLVNKETVASAMALTKRLKKVGVLVGNNPGFVGNRMMFPYMREAQFLLEEGATPWQVDEALRDFGMAMGIMAVDDMGGIDVAHNVNEANKHLRKPGQRWPLVLEELYAMGRLGQKTGKGWYKYDENRKASPDPEVEALIEKMAKAAGIPRRKIEAQEIVERCIYVMINEGALILEEGHALRAGDIDTVYLNGYGFPSYRGGPMWYADTVGLKKVYDKIEEFHKQHGMLWEPAPLLKKLALAGKTFASLDDAKAAAAKG